MIPNRTEYINQALPLEPELKNLFDTKDTLTIFEVGACEGEDSIRYSRLFPNSRIFVFEPLPANIQLIRQNIEKYGVKNVFYYNKAVSSKVGAAEFYVSEGRPDNVASSDWDFGNKSSSLLLPDKHLDKKKFIKFNQKIEVETTTLKHFCEINNISHIDFLHIDVQGAELMVLEGAQSMLSALKAIWLEVSALHLYKDQPLAHDIKKFMTANKFVLVKDTLLHTQGDHLYLSEAFYRQRKKHFKRLVFDNTSFYKKFLRKLRTS
jgi:FkbM family methyltransferase